MKIYPQSNFCYKMMLLPFIGELNKNKVIIVFISAAFYKYSKSSLRRIHR